MSELMDDAHTLPGVSDGGAHTKFFTGGAWPTDFLKRLVRDEGVVSLEEDRGQSSRSVATVLQRRTPASHRAEHAMQQCRFRTHRLLPRWKDSIGMA